MESTMEEDERTPLIAAASTTEQSSENQHQGPSADEWTLATISKRLYVSHFLSTCNSRVFEFGSVLYLATIFPGTLLPMSVYAVCRSASTIVLSSLVGHYIDTGNRLQVVRLSIVLQRVAVAVSCVIFWLLVRGWASTKAWNIGLLAVLIALACVEKVASVMNLVSVERDWVVTIAKDHSDELRAMNSQMRRIDLVCKLFGPFLIGFLDGTVSTEVAVLVNFGMNILSIPLEYWFIAQIYHRVPALQKRENRESRPSSPDDQALSQDLSHTRQRVGDGLKKMGKDLELYFKHQAFLPSFSLALLYLTVLSFSGQMITYLRSTGFTSAQVTTARTVSVGVEVLATWAGPWLMQKIGPIRAGLWFASWQLSCLMLGMAVFWRYTDQPLLSALGLVGGTILSRLGLWGFDLCAQVTVQKEVEESQRGAISTTEASWQSAFELCSYVATMVLSSPEQFKYPATMSVLSVFCSWALYSRFVWRRRGHLLHWPSSCLPQKRILSAEEDSGRAIWQRRSLSDV